MTIGLPRALMYHRFGALWEGFFRELGLQTLTSGDTTARTLARGAELSIDENCLPLKVFLGHVSELADKCDRVLAPRFVRTGARDEFCVRFWGLPDLVRNTPAGARVLTYNIDSKRLDAEPLEFVKMAAALGKSPAAALRAYRAGKAAQSAFDRENARLGREALAADGVKILVAAQPYVARDPYLCGAALGAVRRAGATPVFSQMCDRARCRELSRELSDSLYWTANKEVIGSIALLRGQVDGVLLLTAFPCGTDSLVSELVVRRAKSAPLMQLLLDEHQASAGIETRVESFMDILHQRKANAGRA